MSKLLSVHCKRIPSFTVSTTALCSTSAVEVDTQPRSLLDHLITSELSLSLKQYPEVLLLLSIFPVQSAFE